MPSRPGEQPDPAEELLGRWQAHHAGTPGSSGDGPPPEETPPATDDPPAAPRAAGASGDPAEPGTEAPSAPTGRRRPGRRRATAPEAAPTPVPEPVPAPALASRVAAPAAPVVGATTDVVFPPRLLLRRILGALAALSLAGTVGAGLLAYDDPTTLTVGIAGTLAVLTLVLYGLRVSAAPARVAIHAGQLEVVRGSSREVFDLTSRFTRMEVVGEPGRPGWKVLMGRFGRDPLVIDSSMVDPAQFTAAIERHRPL